MSQHDISWKLPWRPVQHQAEQTGVQRQIEKEITPSHPLWEKEAQVIGRRVDCDDIIVALNDGTYANVHLVWDSESGVRAAKYPWTVIYQTLPELLAAMQHDAAEYNADET